MNCDLMVQYIKFVADRLLVELECEKVSFYITISDMDPDSFGSVDPDPDSFGSVDPDPDSESGSRGVKSLIK